jgi:hypothetical protein
MWNECHARPFGIVGCASMPRSTTDLERPQTPPSWGRFFWLPKRDGGAVVGEGSPGQVTIGYQLTKSPAGAGSGGASL